MKQLQLLLISSSIFISHLLIFRKELSVRSDQWSSVVKVLLHLKSEQMVGLLLLDVGMESKFILNKIFCACEQTVGENVPAN